MPFSRAIVFLSFGWLNGDYIHFRQQFTARLLRHGICHRQTNRPSIIVGYQNAGFENAQYNIATSSMLPVGMARENMKLGDIKPDANFKKSTIRFLNPDGSSPRAIYYGVKYPANYVYLSGSKAGDGDGWYLQADAEEDAEFNQNDLPMPFGTGYLIYRHSDEAEAHLVHSGEVQKDPVTLDFPNAQYNIAGNCSPAPIKIGDITPGSTFVRSTIRFLNPDGSSPRAIYYGVKYPANYVYLSGSKAGDGDGWYLQADAEEDAEFNQNEEIGFDPGEGFLVYRHSDEANAQLLIPSALPAEK